MSTFDEEGFKKSATAAGYSKPEIDAYLAKQKQMPEPTVSNANNYEEFVKEDINKQTPAVERLKEKAAEPNSAIPYLVGGGAAAAIGAGALGANKVYGSLKDKMADQPRIEPTMDGTTRVPGEPTLDLKALNPDVPIQQAPTAKPTIEQLRERVGLPVETVPAVQNSVAPITNAPVATTAPAVEPTLEPAKPPEAKTRRKPGVAPEGTTLRPDLGPGDNTLFNTYGPEGRKAMLEKYNQGKPAVTDVNATAIREKMLAEQITPGRRELPKSIATERGIPPTGAGNFGKLGVKIAGVGLALTAAQMAQAAEEARKGNYGPATESGFNLLGMIPGLGTAFNAATFSKGANEGEDEELLKALYRGKVGGGRGSQGVPPPTR